MRPPTFIIAIGVAVALSVAVNEPSRASSNDDKWRTGFVPPGIWGDAALSQEVYAVTSFNGDLIAGGDFHVAGGQATDYIARWDGNEWYPLVADMSGSVRAFTHYNNSLIVGGTFALAGGVMTFCIGRWDGTTWYPMGAGTDGAVFALATYNGVMFAGGLFGMAGGMTATRVARWDGTTWASVGGGVSHSTPAMASVAAMDVYNGELIVAGVFETAGGVPANNIAKWNGTTWSALATGVDGVVSALTVHNNELIAGGTFASAGGSPAVNLAAWNGSSWRSLGSGTDDHVASLAVFGGELIVGGAFSHVDGVAASCIARWTGASWQTLGTGVEGDAAASDGVVRVRVSAFGEHDGALFAAGDFAEAGGQYANRIARWSGSAWSTLGTGDGLSTVAHAAVAHGAALVVGGRFSGAGTSTASRIAQWDGDDWIALGDGVSVGSPCNGCDPYVLSLASNGADLIVGGDFQYAGGVEVNSIARWDGASWHALGSGLVRDGHPLNAQVLAATYYGGNVVAAGQFTAAGGNSAANVAMWNDTTWSALGSGLGGAARAVTVYGGDLIAAGDFTQAGGGAANRIARWNGSSWFSLGSGMDGRIFALTNFDGDLVAGGTFTTAGGVPAGNLARWNGSSWSALGLGANNDVRALCTYGGDLVAGGFFTTLGGIVANRVARYDGAAWGALGSGMDRVVVALAEFGDVVIAGGDFTTAGGKPSYYIAEWNDNAQTPVFFTSFRATPGDGKIQLSWEVFADEEIVTFDLQRWTMTAERLVELHRQSIPADRRHFIDRNVEPAKPYYYTLGAVLTDGSVVRSPSVSVVVTRYRLALDQNYPNPFNPTTTIRFVMPERSDVRLDIYSTSGALVRRLVGEALSGGQHEIEWNGVDDHGSRVSSGVYFYRLTVGKQSVSRKMVLLK